VVAGIWRPVAVAAILTGTTLLPQATAEAAVPQPANCVETALGGILDRMGLHLGSCYPGGTTDGQAAAPFVPPTACLTAGLTDDLRDAAAPPAAAAAPPIDAIGLIDQLLPSHLLDLSGWKLTLPTGQQGRPTEIGDPQLADFTDDFFRLNDTRNGVAFRANAGGVTTSGSHYPRSELREMNGAQKAAWSSADGTHTLDVCEAITRTPVAKPEVVSAQIHDDQDDVLQIRLDGNVLSAQYDDGKGRAVLDPAYRLGTPFRTKIVVTADGIAVSYNGVHKADIKKSGTGWYWKVGAYVQSNTSKGDSPDAVGEVVVYSLDRATG
jgi:hypothetical protein